MKITIKRTDKENSQIQLVITVPWSVWSKEIDVEADALAKTMKVQGFRTGKIPRDVVEREAGRAALVQGGAERALKQAYAQAVGDEKIAPLGAPDIAAETVKDGEDMTFTATVAVVPTVELSKGWRDKMTKFNKLQAKKSDKVTVTDAEVAAELQKLADSRATTAPVKRAAADGDVAIMDFVVTVDNVPIEGGTSKGHSLVLGSGAFIPGFEEAVVGMVAGEEKTVTLPFPKEYHAKHLAGQDADFAVKLIRVEERTIPVLDDAFAQSLGAQFKALSDIQKNIREGMTQELEGRAQDERRSAVAEELEKYATVAIPDVLIQQELTKMESRFGEQLQQSGMTLDDMLAKMDKTKDALLDEWRPQAVKRVTIGLALDQIFIDMELTVPQEKIQAQINTMLMQYGGLEEAQKKVDVAALYSYVKNSLQQEEVLEYLEQLGMTKPEDK